MIQTVKTPWHLWLVAVLALLWNGFGAYDCLMSVMLGDPHLRSAGMTDTQIAYFNRLPSLMLAGWVIAECAGLAGAVLLLLRRRWALWALAASFAGVLSTIYYTLIGLPDWLEVMGGSIVLTGVVAVIALFLVVYAWWMARRGVLR